MVYMKSRIRENYTVLISWDLIVLLGVWWIRLSPPPPLRYILVKIIHRITNNIFQIYTVYFGLFLLTEQYKLDRLILLYYSLVDGMENIFGLRAVFRSSKIDAEGNGVMAQCLRWLEPGKVSDLHGECKIWEESLRMNTTVERRGDGRENDVGKQDEPRHRGGAPATMWGTPRTQRWQLWMSAWGMSTRIRDS